MLLRTSSNPIAQSILSSAFPDSPKREPLASAATCRQISCPRFGYPNIIRKHIKRSNKEFRRALSDSNLEALVCSSDHSCDTQDNQFAHRFQGFPPDTYNNNNDNNNINMLETAPSLSSIFNSVQDGAEDPTSVVVLDGLGEIGMLADVQTGLERTVTIGDKIEDVIGADFSFARSSMGSIVEEEGEGEPEEEEEEDQQNLDHFDPPSSPPMYLATGLGIDPISCNLLAWNFKSREDLEKHYRTMVEEFPSHPLLLRNYAELLKEKGDLHGAEKYYLQATVADPEDGAILSQYAKLVWELHADRERAEEYFERAAQVAPQDCRIFAAYASFLWEAEDSSEEPSKLESNVQVLRKEEENVMDEGCNMFSFDEAQRSVGPTLRLDDGLGDGSAGVGGGNSGSSAAMGGPSGDASLEQYYRRRVEENPYNPLVLGNYAHFLYQSKGDLKGAEEYYNRALLLDQSDGDILSHYAKLVWELHGDKDKAQNYFDRAVKTAPGNSHVLAAYASFLWATGSEDEDDTDEEVEAIQIPCLQFPMSQGILTAPRA